MSFGWSVGDIVAGINVIWGVYDAVSDGPLNAKFEATQFFADVKAISDCLVDWDRRSKPSSSSDAGLSESIREQCADFIERHMRLINDVNGDTKDKRLVRQSSASSSSVQTQPRRLAWLKPAKFTREQVFTLYQKAVWPFKREEVAKLRNALELTLGVATYQVSAAVHDISKDTNGIVKDLNETGKEISEIVKGIDEKLENWRRESFQTEQISSTQARLIGANKGSPAQLGEARSEPTLPRTCWNPNLRGSLAEGPSPVKRIETFPSNQSRGSLTDETQAAWSSSSSVISMHSTRASSVLIQIGLSIPVDLHYGNRNVSSVPSSIIAISRSRDGVAKSVTTLSKDGQIEFQHSTSLPSSSPYETSMKPFLHNTHVEKDYKLRVAFLGSHKLEITETKAIPTKKYVLPFAPEYVFANEADFLTFQFLLLNRNVKRYADFKRIVETTDRKAQLRQGTISILSDAADKTRSIMYFRAADQQPNQFVEWSVNLFQEPGEPKSKSLKLVSQNDKALSISSQSRASRSTSGQSAQSSVVSTATDPLKASPGRSKPPIKRLKLEFYDEDACKEFWKEFIKKEDMAFRDPVWE